MLSGHLLIALFGDLITWLIVYCDFSCIGFYNNDFAFLFVRNCEIKQLRVGFCVDFLQHLVAKRGAQMRHWVVVVTRLVFEPFVVGEIEHSLFAKPRAHQLGCKAVEHEAAIGGQHNHRKVAAQLVQAWGYVF